MEKNPFSIGWFIIASAIVWGVVMLACAFALKGTDGYMRIQVFLGMGAAVHLIVIWVPLAAKIKKTMNEKT
jgi:hypothetical protein